MRAMVVTQFGPPEVLQFREMDPPQPGGHDLLVRVRAAAVNPLDTKVRRGAFAKGRTLPIVLGYDVCGVVEAVGAEADGFAIGDEVMAAPAVGRDGANAQYLCVDARTAGPKPHNVDHVHAAALPLVSLTAWESLYERANVQVSETVLIHAGGGGVGHVAIQLAKLRRCRVLTTASRAESIRLCDDLGADVVINYQHDDFVGQVHRETAGKGCHVILDTVGDDVLQRSMSCLAVGGRLVSVVGSRSGVELRDLFVRNATLHMELVEAPTMYGINPQTQGRILRQIADLVDRGQLRIHVSQCFPLDALAQAHQLQESGHVSGKIVIGVD